MRRIIPLIALVVFCFANQPSHATDALPPDLRSLCATRSLNTADPRYPADQIVLICIPPGWNKDLVVYAHGYVPPQEPLKLPLDELTLPDGRTVPGILLSLGYAFATSSYHKNGYAIEQAGNDLNALVRHVATVVAPGQVRNVYITGGSEGGLVAAMLLERHPETYHAGLALCGPVGGAPYQVKYLTDFRAVFDYYYPSVFPFGVYNVPATAFQFWDFYQIAIAGAIVSDPAGVLRLFNVTGAASDPRDRTTYIQTAASDLFYSIWGARDLVETAGGQPYGNLLTRYSGSGDDAVLNRGVERFASDPEAREYIRNFYQTTGNLSRPLVTLHNIQDPAVPFRHELLYRAAVRRWNRDLFLTQLPVYRYGHCNFTPDEILGAFQLMVLRSR